MTFDTLGLRPESLRAVADQGYTSPTPVQERAIPAILAGRDVLAGAQTGTGKTAAFVLPMLQLLHAHRGPGPRRVRALVLVPTRELALQVEQSVRTYGAHRPIRSVAIYGGVRMDGQVRALRHGAEIVVATPGRLLDHVRQSTIDLSGLAILVLDEADRMLDMGFIRDIRRILELLPVDRQSLLFSATFEPAIRRLAEELLRDPVSLDVSPRNTPPVPIQQLLHPVDPTRRAQLLAHLVRSGRIGGQVLVFTRTKRGASRLAQRLDRDGITAAPIHGDRSQSQRVRALSAFKAGRVQVLVATDIAARGLDIEALPHVVNFELPHVPEDYVHRIGRTGRAGLTGMAISLVSADDQAAIRAIERLVQRPIEREVIEGFEPTELPSDAAFVQPSRPAGRAGPHGRAQIAPTQGTRRRPGGRRGSGGHAAGRSGLDGRESARPAARRDGRAEGWPGERRDRARRDGAHGGRPGQRRVAAQDDRRVAGADDRRDQVGSGPRPVGPRGARGQTPAIGPRGTMAAMPGERLSGGRGPGVAAPRRQSL